MTLLLKITASAVDYYVASEAIEAGNQFYQPKLKALIGLKYSLSRARGGYAKITAGSLQLTPDVLPWPPPVESDVDIKYRNKDGSITDVLVARARLSNITATTISYDIHEDAHDTLMLVEPTASLPTAIVSPEDGSTDTPTIIENAVIPVYFGKEIAAGSTAERNPTNAHLVSRKAQLDDKTLNGAINASVTTITLNNTTDMNPFGDLVEIGTETIEYTFIDGNDLKGCVRGSDRRDGTETTAASHSDGASVSADDINSARYYDSDVKTSITGITLGASIDASVTTITMSSTVGFPATGVIRIGTEHISYTGISSSDLTGCTRGYESTTAASHTIGDVVYLDYILQTFEVFDDGVDVTVVGETNVTSVFPDGQFRLEPIPIGEIRVRGDNRDAYGTLDDVFAWACDASRLNLTLDTTYSQSPSPDVSVFVDKQQKIVDFLDDLAQGYGHLFYISGTTLYLIDMLSASGSLALDENKIISTDYKYTEAFEKLVADWIVLTPAKNKDNFPVYTVLEKQQVVNMAQSYGRVLNMSVYHVEDQLVGTQRKNEIVADAMIHIGKVLQRSWGRIVIPFDHGFVTPGMALTYVDTTLKDDTSITLHARSIDYNFDGEVMSIEGDGDNFTALATPTIGEATTKISREIKGVVSYRNHVTVDLNSNAQGQYKTIQSAVTALPDGGTIFLKNGNYIISTNIDFGTASYEIVGENKNKTKIVVVANGVTPFEAQPTGEFTVRNLTFKLGAKTVTTFSAPFIDVSGVGLVTISTCVFDTSNVSSGTSYHLLVRSASADVSSCIFSHGVNRTRSVLFSPLAISSANYSFKNCTVTEGDRISCSVGNGTFFAYNNTFVDMDGGAFSGSNTQGTYIYKSNTISLKAASSYVGTRRGIATYGKYIAIDSNTITLDDSALTTISTNLIELSGSGKGTISNNTLELKVNITTVASPTMIGIDVDGDNTTVSGNHVVLHQYATTSVANLIGIECDSDENNVDGNTILHTGVFDTTTADPGKSMAVYLASTCDATVVQNNIYSAGFNTGGGDPGVLDLGGATYANTIVNNTQNTV